MRRFNLNQTGQTIIVLLIFVLVAMTLTLAAAAVAIINTQSNNSYVQGNLALTNAQTGAENALVRLERNPSYSGGSMTLARGTATISISGTAASKAIVSVGTVGNLHRTVTVSVTISGQTLSVDSWKETP